ncbi:DNA replication complex GINS family protein [Candidatus Woesearchaeota archaeon]|nr:DNA replication complex GINS family protein [Candidatus Woesearchaeota archaeon]
MSTEAIQQSAAGAADGNNGNGGNSGGSSGKVTVTYETLFDLVVREKGKDELQQLSPSFFTDLVSYLNEKKAMFSIMGAEERERAARQLQNINRLIKELYERREKKIVSMALARSRAGADIVDTATLLAEEKELFEGMVTQLDSFRSGVLNSLLAAKTPEIHRESWQSKTAARTVAVAADVKTATATTATAEADGNEEKPNAATRLVRFLHAVPKFVGKELEVYGPFDEEDIANLPKDIADVLILKGRAEEMGQEPKP